MRKYQMYRTIMVLFLGVFVTLAGCSKKGANIESQPSVTPITTDEEVKNTEKGYELPISNSQKEAADKKCREKMGLLAEIYQSAEKGSTLNVSISTETRSKMLEQITETGVPVVISNVLSNMGNYKQVEAFLNQVKQGQKASVTIYEIHSDGGIGQKEFSYDGTDMYLLYTCGVWGEESKTITTSFSYNRVENWEYTDKGWFIYELCVPEFPEVTEEIIGYGMLRIRPLPEEQLDFCREYLLPIGYQGNNLFVTEWEEQHMEKINYNQLFQYLYEIKCQKPFDEPLYEEGIEKEEFEQMMEEFLPVTREIIENTAVFDETKDNYEWKRLGCMNYSPYAFATSIPEIVTQKVNKDGTITYTIDAVCELLGTDRAFSHELTVRKLENGKVKYICNHILYEGENKDA